MIAALVVLMRRHEEAFPLLAMLALPFRVPISADGRTVNLLVPLYLVVAAGAVAHLLPALLDAAAPATRRGARGAGDRRCHGNALAARARLLGLAGRP